MFFPQDIFRFSRRLSAIFKQSLAWKLFCWFGDVGAHRAAEVEQGALPGANQRQGLVVTENIFREQVSTLDI